MVAGRRLWGPRYLVLPVIALACGPAASLMRFTRGATIEVLAAGLRPHRAGEGTQPDHHRPAARPPNAMLPILTILGLRFGQILAGAIVIEGIFSWPGMGSAVLNAISSRDLPVISAYVLLAGVFFVVDQSHHRCQLRHARSPDQARRGAADLAA